MKPISIQDLLKWAFTFELGKVGAGDGGSFSAAWRFTERMAELGTMIDRTPNSLVSFPASSMMAILIRMRFWSAMPFVVWRVLSLTCRKTGNVLGSR